GAQQAGPAPPAGRARPAAASCRAHRLDRPLAPASAAPPVARSPRPRSARATARTPGPPGGDAGPAGSARDTPAARTGPGRGPPAAGPEPPADRPAYRDWPPGEEQSARAAGRTGGSRAAGANHRSAEPRGSAQLACPRADAQAWLQHHPGRSRRWHHPQRARSPEGSAHQGDALRRPPRGHRGRDRAMSLDESLTYEQALAQLDATLHALEEGKLSLEEAIAAVARGREYLQLCERKLEEARQRIESLPVREEPDVEEPPHPATVAELRAERGGPPGTPQGEIPF